MGLQEDNVGGICGAHKYFRGRALRRSLVRRSTLERGAKEGNSPVFENHFVLLVIYLEYLKAKITLREASRTNRLRLNTLVSPIANQYREGKVKSSPLREVK